MEVARVTTKPQNCVQIFKSFVFISQRTKFTNLQGGKDQQKSRLINLRKEAEKRERQLPPASTSKPNL
jgi:hypothetical protein